IDLHQRFPGISAFLAEHGLDLHRDLVPVRPAAHYMMGGIRTDLMGRTTVRGLYAAGEAACTGVHGANRLASNSLLEGLVFGARAARAMTDDDVPPVPVDSEFPAGLPLSGGDGELVGQARACARQLHGRRGAALTFAATFRAATMNDFRSTQFTEVMGALGSNPGECDQEDCFPTAVWPGLLPASQETIAQTARIAPI